MDARFIYSVQPEYANPLFYDGQQLEYHDRHIEIHSAFISRIYIAGFAAGHESQTNFVDHLFISKPDHPANFILWVDMGCLNDTMEYNQGQD